jgi:hypothetical protein
MTDKQFAVWSCCDAVISWICSRAPPVKYATGDCLVSTIIEPVSMKPVGYFVPMADVSRQIDIQYDTDWKTS